MNALLITEGKQNLCLVIKKNKDQAIIYNSHSADYIELKKCSNFYPGIMDPTVSHKMHRCKIVLIDYIRRTITPKDYI
jgi:hypothetical protein